MWFSRGFTLLELLIAMAVLTLLMSLAYPRYHAYIRQSNRRAVEVSLLAGAGRLESFYEAHRSYAGATWHDLSLQPVESHYTFQFSEKTDDHYRLEAVPLRGQDQDRCKLLWINERGRHGAADANCW